MSLGAEEKTEFLQKAEKGNVFPKGMSDLSKYYHDEMNWYESIIEIIASYLYSTDQQENYVLYKQIYKDFYQDVYEESYLDFKKSVKFKLKEKEYYHAKNLLNHLGDEEDE